MTIKEYIKRNNISIAQISAECNIPYSTVSELINGKVEIDQCRVGNAMKITKACHLPFDDFYSMCKEVTKNVAIDRGRIFIRNKRYYVSFEIEGEKRTVELCKVNKRNTQFVQDMAKWKIEAAEREKRIMEVEEWKIGNIM